MLENDLHAPTSFSMSERGDGEPHYVEALVRYYGEALKRRASGK
jgi:hypothetical protein